MVSSLDSTQKYSSLTRKEKINCYIKSHAPNVGLFVLFAALVLTCALYAAISFNLSGGFNMHSVQNASIGLKLTFGITCASFLLALIATVPDRKNLHREYDRILARKNKAEIDYRISKSEGGYLNPDPSETTIALLTKVKSLEEELARLTNK